MAQSAIEHDLAEMNVFQAGIGIMHSLHLAGLKWNTASPDRETWENA